MHTASHTHIAALTPLIASLHDTWTSLSDERRRKILVHALRLVTNLLEAGHEAATQPHESTTNGKEAAPEPLPYNPPVRETETDTKPAFEADDATAGTTTAGPASTPAETPKAEGEREKARNDSLLIPGRIARCLEEKWDLRYNSMTCNLERRPKGYDAETFTPVDKRMHNAMVIDVQEHIPLCYKSWVDSYLMSEKVEMYHPLRHYLEHLPTWDGHDHVDDLARRVSGEEMWLKVFRRWMRGMVKGWLAQGTDEEAYANQMAPLLISERQGLGKSTFCRNLLPAELQDYYTDKFDLTADSGAERCLASCGLINMDEYDRYSERQTGTLKNLMQLTEVKVKQPYAHGVVRCRRVASLIGTSNYSELLTDPTGSRRFYCQAVTDVIDRSPLPHAQLYAQVMAEIAAGEPTFFSKEEEQEIERHNRTFYHTTPLAEAFMQRYDVACGGGPTVWMATGKIYEDLRKHFPHALQGVSVQQMGRALRALHVPKRRRQFSMEYGVRRKTC